MAKQPSSKVPPNLVALGTAAVLTVYGAGYWRTRAAAEHFADDTRRRPAPPESPYASPPVVAEPPALALPLAPRTTPIEPEPEAAPAKVSPSSRNAAPVEKPSQPAAPKAVMPVSAATPAVPPTSTATSTAPTNTAATSTAPLHDSAVTAGSAPASTPTPAAPSAAAAPQALATTSTETTSAPAPSAAPKWKDGSYTGWGTSRHGDIQATVVVEAGRIVSATISQCLTRYSCSWIAALPPQVVSRQSPETDYVSGATQSTNAFYYAVVEALAKAK